jgi:hypothetical protein
MRFSITKPVPEVYVSVIFWRDEKAESSFGHGRRCARGDGNFKRRPMISTVICTTVMSGMCGREIQTGMKKCIIVSSAMQSVGISYSAILRGTCYHGQHKNCSDLHWQRGSSEGLLQCQVWIHIHIMIGSNEFGVFYTVGSIKCKRPFDRSTSITIRELT